MEEYGRYNITHDEEEASLSDTSLIDPTNRKKRGEGEDEEGGITSTKRTRRSSSHTTFGCFFQCCLLGYDFIIALYQHLDDKQR